MCTLKFLKTAEKELLQKIVSTLFGSSTESDISSRFVQSVLYRHNQVAARPNLFFISDVAKRTRQSLRCLPHASCAEEASRPFLLLGCEGAFCEFLMFVSDRQITVLHSAKFHVCKKQRSVQELKIHKS